jgi:hypothetical protein
MYTNHLIRDLTAFAEKRGRTYLQQVKYDYQ